MKVTVAQKIAEQLKSELLPYCDRIEIAGSIRRSKPEVKDIELVCITKKEQASLFDLPEMMQPIKEFVDIVNKYERVKGSAIGKYTQRILPEGIKLDLFTATKDNWGLIYAIRTGSADYSHYILATRWVKLGYISKNGFLHKDGKIIPVQEEQELFDLLKMPWIEPHKRL
jgi:DNA polymerase/3'-5' exonuclease PolX